MNENNLAEFIEEGNRLIFSAIKAINSENTVDLAEEKINVAFRAIHTIKGTAAFFDVPEIKIISHKIEGLLEKLRLKSMEIDLKYIKMISGLLSDFYDVIQLLKTNKTQYVFKVMELKHKIDNTAAIMGITNYYTEPQTTEIVEEIVPDVKKLISTKTFDDLKFFAEKITTQSPSTFKLLKAYRTIAENLEKNFLNIHDKLYILSFSLKTYIDFLLKKTDAHIDAESIKLFKEISDLFHSTISLELMDINDMHMDISDAVQKVKAMLSNHGEAVDFSPIATAANFAFNEFNKQQFSVRVEPAILNQISDKISDFEKMNYEAQNLCRDFQQNHPKEDLGKLRQILSESELIQKELRKLCASINKVPLIALFQRLQILINQVSKQLKKDIRFEYIGEEIQLDKDILETLKDCFSHLVRNSCDHGIESAEERIKNNKKPYGTIHIGAVETGDTMYLQFKDDGRGINFQKLKQTLLQNNAATKENLDKMASSELIKFIFNPGVSTAERVTEISGRGVGLDVLNFYVKKLNGTINVTSEKGEFTEFNITLPITPGI